MVELYTHSKKTEKSGFDNLLRGLNLGAEPSFLRFFNNNVQRLFNYGMYASGDRDAVKVLLQELFTLARKQADLAGNGWATDSNLFRLFRGLLINSRKKDLFRGMFEHHVPAYTTVTETGLSCTEREAIFLKFYVSFSDREIGIVMDLEIEQAQQLLKQGVEALSHQLRKRQS